MINNLILMSLMTNEVVLDFPIKIRILLFSTVHLVKQVGMYLEQKYTYLRIRVPK